MNRGVFACAALSLVLAAQTLPSFEVASIRVHQPGPGPLHVSTAVEAARINFTNVTLRGCIRAAYGPRPYQITGGPGWLNDDRFDIIAKAAQAAPRAQLMLMLQSLLAERFHLAVHFETREVPVYSLVVDRRGLKIHPVTDNGAGMQVDGDETHPVVARNISMTGLAQVLSRTREIDRPVIDNTGIGGVFNISLEFGPDDSVFTALSEQLGLRMEPAKGPVPMLVVDHAEKPESF